jgi:hypothetical protein
MHTRNRRSLPTLAAGVILVLILVACGADAPSASSSPSTLPSSAPSVVPSATPSTELSEAPSAPPASVVAGTQTDTAWGRIWDAVPSGFPMFPGSSVADPVSPDPVSTTFAIEGGDAGEIAAWMQAAVETAGFGTESMSGPLESGTFELESIGPGDCRVQTTIAPMGSLTIISVRYGAGCPAA